MREKENPFSEQIKDFDQRIKAALEKRQEMDVQEDERQDAQELSAEDVEKSVQTTLSQYNQLFILSVPS